jgi:hypothetical protein
MIIKTHLKNKAVKALCESMTVQTMVQLARECIHNYNLHEQTGFPASISIPSADAAKQIVDDICRLKLFPQFLQVLIRAQNSGFKGRKYPIAYLSHLIHGIQTHGYVFDSENDMFIEDPRLHKSPNWGVLREGMEYNMTFLRFDISGNTRLVRDYPEKVIKKTYQDLFSIITAAVEKRNGRVWNIQGDGGLVAFCFFRKDLSAVISAVESLHDLFLYNRLGCPLQEGLKVRFAVHAGGYMYNENREALKKSETIKELLEIESKYTEPNSITISNKVFISLDKRIADLFHQCPQGWINTLFNYSLQLEQ